MPGSPPQRWSLVNEKLMVAPNIKQIPFIHSLSAFIVPTSFHIHESRGGDCGLPSPVRYAKFESIRYFIDIDILQNCLIDMSRLPKILNN